MTGKKRGWQKDKQTEQMAKNRELAGKETE